MCYRKIVGKRRIQDPGILGTVVARIATCLLEKKERERERDIYIYTYVRDMDIER